MPYSNKPDATAPSTKYFIAASEERPSSRLNATSAYMDSASNSSPKYTTSKWLAETITNIPSTANSPSRKNSLMPDIAVFQVFACIHKDPEGQ